MELKIAYLVMYYVICYKVDMITTESEDNLHYLDGNKDINYGNINRENKVNDS